MQKLSSSSRRRILIAVGNYPPGYGGAGLRVHRSYLRLRDRLPLDLQAATVSGRGDMEGCTAFEGVPVFQTSADNGFFPQFFALGRLFFRSGRKRINLVHALGQSGVATAAAAWALLLGIPVVRELTVNQPVKRSRHPIAVLRRLTFTRAKLVVALNAGLERRLVETGVDPDKIWERPNPVDTTYFCRPDEAQRREARRSFGLDSEELLHLVLGRFCARKNQLFALDVLARLPQDHRLLLLGPILRGDDDYLAAVRRRISELSLEGRVILLPEHLEDTRRAYHAADCCWIPSTYEGMPNVLLEALVCGLPVVTNQSLDLGEHVLDGINGFARPLEPESFANGADLAIDRLADNVCAAKIAKASAERYAAEKIDLEFARRLSQILGLAPGEATVTGRDNAGRCTEGQRS